MCLWAYTPRATTSGCALETSNGIVVVATSNTNSIVDFCKKLRARARDIKDRVESMRGKRVIVGIPKSAHYPNGQSVAHVADLISYGVHEDGSPMRAGPRRFMTVATEENKGKWSRMVQDGVRTALRREKRPNLRPLMIEVGETMQKDIRDTMLEMDVYDTGRMFNSISILQINNKRLLA